MEGKLEEETMLAENIVKDHKFIMMISTMEIAMETLETDSREEGHLLKDVNKEEPCAKDLTLGKGTLTKECFEEDGQSFEDVESLEEYSRRTEYNGEDLLNEGSSDLLQQKDLENTRVKGIQYFNTVTQHMKDEVGRREHCDEVLAKCVEDIKLLEKLMREPDCRTKTTVIVYEEEDVSQVVMETGRCNNLFVGSLKSMNEYEYVIRDCLKMVKRQ